MAGFPLAACDETARAGGPSALRGRMIYSLGASAPYLALWASLPAAATCVLLRALEIPDAPLTDCCGQSTPRLVWARRGAGGP